MVLLSNPTYELILTIGARGREGAEGYAGNARTGVVVGENFVLVTSGFYLAFADYTGAERGCYVGICFGVHGGTSKAGIESDEEDCDKGGNR